MSKCRLRWRCRTEFYPYVSSDDYRDNYDLMWYSCRVWKTDRMVNLVITKDGGYGGRDKDVWRACVFSPVRRDWLRVPKAAFATFVEADAFVADVVEKTEADRKSVV